MNDSIQLNGHIENIIFTNQENGYSVFLVAYEKTKSTCVGIVPNIRMGELVQLTGNWSEHKKFGKQFVFSEIKRMMPSKEDSLVKYLASGLVKGIGEKTAIRIIETFKEKTLDIIENQPIRLAEIKGISEKKALLLGETINEQKNLAAVIIFFSKYNISSVIALRAYKQFKEDTLSLVKKNPYRLCTEEIGLNFKKADNIANGEGLEPTASERITAGIVYVLYRASQAGNTFLEKDNLIALSKRILFVDEVTIEQEIDNCIYNNILVSMDMKVYLLKYYDAEQFVSDKIKSLCKINYVNDKTKIEKVFMDSLKNMNIKLDDNQKKAVNIALYNGISIISGGPGTGKTTIIKVLIDTLYMLGIKFFLAAPTGRAAKKMEEYSLYESKTIHRLLEVDIIGDKKDTVFLRNEHNPLECDVLIIDEVSMVDIILFQSLLKAMPLGSRIVLIGDANQLPAIGPGSVLKDMIDSNKISYMQLDKIYRHTKLSKIPEFSKDIIEGRLPKQYTNKEGINIINCDSTDETLNVIEKTYKNLLSNNIDIQVITPSKKDVLGTISLNKYLQEIINPKSPLKSEKKFIYNVFRQGDKVMQIRNNYDLYYKTDIGEGYGIYNGDIGYVHYINEKEEYLTILYDKEKLVTYQYNELDQIELAYCITVHKSQGSEYECVIIPLYKTYDFLLNRKLLYTAITRAKQYLYLIGNQKIINTMIHNFNTRKRNSGLIDMLK